MACSVHSVGLGRYTAEKSVITATVSWVQIDRAEDAEDAYNLFRGSASRGRVRLRQLHRETKMNTDSTPTEQTPSRTPDVPPQGEGGTHKRPVVWMILAGVAIAAAIGLGAWALLLNDDLNDTEAELEAQTAAAESASAEAERRIADARARIDAALSDVAGVVVVSDEDVAEAEQAAAEAEQSVADAQAAVDQAQSELEQASAERDLARAEAEQARAEAAQAELCADASLAATQALAENDDAADGYEAADRAPRRPRAPARKWSSRWHPPPSPSRAGGRWGLVATMLPFRTLRPHAAARLALARFAA